MSEIKYSNNLQTPFNVVTNHGKKVQFAGGQIYVTSDTRDHEYLEQFVKTGRISKEERKPQAAKPGVKA